MLTETEAEYHKFISEREVAVNAEAVKICPYEKTIHVLKAL
jgi:hypothetical protein